MWQARKLVNVVLLWSLHTRSRPARTPQTQVLLLHLLPLHPLQHVIHTTHALLQPPAAVSMNMVHIALPGVVAHWSLLSAVLTTPAAALMTIPSATSRRVLAMQ